MTTKMPPMVAAALAQRQLEPDDLRSFEITDVDVFLHMKQGFGLRVEISSLPALVVEVPETAQAGAPGTAQAAPEPKRAQKRAKSAGTRAKTTQKRASRARK